MELYTRHVAKDNRGQWRDAKMVVYGCFGNLIRAAEETPKAARAVRHKFVACVNSYFGRSLPCRAYNVRLRSWGMIAPEWKEIVCGCAGLRKIKERFHTNFMKV